MPTGDYCGGHGFGDGPQEIPRSHIKAFHLKVPDRSADKYSSRTGNYPWIMLNSFGAHIDYLLTLHKVTYVHLQMCVILTYGQTILENFGSRTGRAQLPDILIYRIISKSKTPLL